MYLVGDPTEKKGYVTDLITDTTDGPMYIFLLTLVNPC